MGDIIDDIHSEHKVISRLLDRLGEETGLFEKGERPDFHLLKDIIEYFQTGVGQHHHPREAFLFEALAGMSPEAAAAVSDLRDEHEALLRHLGDMAQAISSILLEAEVSRVTFVAMTRNYIARQKHHMAMEEDVILAMARAQMDAARLRELGKTAREELAARPRTAGLERFGHLLRREGQEGEDSRA